MQPGTLSDPAFTWNFWLTLFLVPLCVTLLGRYLGHQASKYYEGWQKYNDLRDENEKVFKSQTLAHYTCLRASIEILKTTKADKNDLINEAQKIKNDLVKEAEDIWDRVNNHEHGIKCNSSYCTAKNTEGVITNPH